MHRITRFTATTAALALAASMTVAASHGEGDCYVAIAGDVELGTEDVLACEEQHWFHRATTHAGNLGHVAEPHGLPTFDTTPPAGSVSGGNGGGMLTWGTVLIGGDDDLLDAPFTGTFTGVIDRLDIDIHALVSTYDALGDVIGPIEHPIDLVLTIDGAEVFKATDLKVLSVPEESSDAGSRRLDMAITGIADLLAGFDLPNGPDTVHEVELLIAPGPFLDDVMILAFDTTEVPGGIGFNRVDIPAGTLVVKAG